MCLLPFFLVLVISIGASYFAARKKADYFLANRSLKWPVLLGTFLGAQIGGGFILGNTEASFHHGLFGSMYGVGIAVGMLLLGSGFGAKLRTLNIGTLPELLKTKYGSSAFQKISAIVSIASLAGGLMCQAIGLKMFLSSLGFGGHLIYFIAWSSVVLYTTYGGLLAVVWTDTIQALIMIAMLVITFVSALGPNLKAIIVSTASAILLALSSNVAHDITKGQHSGHLCTLITGLAASLGPYISDDIIAGLVVSYEISVGALFIPVICAVLTKRAQLPKEAAIGAALLGSIGTILSQYSQMSFLGIAAPFILSPAGFAIGWLIAKNRRPAVELWT